MSSKNEVNELSQVIEETQAIDVNDANITQNDNSTVFGRRNRNKSIVWQQFRKISETQAQCNTCKRLFKIKSGNTSGLSRHLSAKHVAVSIRSPNMQTAATSSNISEIVPLHKGSLRAKQLIVLNLHAYNIVIEKGSIP